MPVPFALPSPDPGFEFSIASRGMSQGLMQTEGIQIIPRAYVRIGAVQIGGQWRNVSSQSASGVAAFFLRTSRTFGKLQLDGGAAYRIRTGTRTSANSRAWEFSAGARLKIDRIGLRINTEYSPREFESGQSLYVELGSTLNLGDAVNLSANAGRREHNGGPDYTSFNTGISKLVRHKLSLDARYYRTDRGELGVRYRGRIVVSARLFL